jgi:GNAT superfamily N-acetyltransferase
MKIRYLWLASLLSGYAYALKTTIRLEGNRLTLVDSATGKDTGWVIFESHPFLGPKHAYVHNLYVAKHYRNQGLTKPLFHEIIQELKKKGFTTLHWIADPFERVEYPDGSCGDYIYETTAQTYEQHLQKLVDLYRKVGAQPHKNSDGSYKRTPSPYSGMPCIPFTLKITDFIEK